MPNGNISQIEQGKVSPTIQSLQRILSAVGVTLSDFFGANMAPQNPVLALRDFYHQHQSEGDRWVSHGLIGAMGVSLKREIILPGATMASNWPNSDAIIFGVVASGAAIMYLHEVAYPLKMGDGFRLNAKDNTRFQNSSAEQTVLVSFLVQAPSSLVCNSDSQP